MKPLLLLLIALFLGPCLLRSQEVYGLEARRGTHSEAPSAEALSDDELAAISPGLPAIIRKIRANEALTLVQFIVYIRCLERHPANISLIETSAQATREEPLPAQGWALLGTRLHSYHYASDRTLSFYGVDLFKNGSENRGWERVELFGAPPPKFVKNIGGDAIDIAHAYAAIAALVMRKNRVTGNLMGAVNTGWGDQVQVTGHRITGAARTVGGVVTLNADRRRSGITEFANAPDFKPPEQRRGNRFGMLAHDYLQKHRDAPLSRAFSDAYVKMRMDGSP